MNTIACRLVGHTTWFRKTSLWALLWVLLAGLAPVAYAKESALEEVLDALLAPWQEASAPGLVVGIARDGATVVTRSQGAAHLEQQVPNSEATRFNAGSLTKSLTAYALLRLEHEGRLNLSDPLKAYLDDLPGPYRELTLEQLLHHTSGLKDDWTLASLAGWESGDVRTHEQTRRLLLRQRDLDFEPGATFAYTNSGYILLADVINAVTDASFPYWMRQEIFLPLRMYNTIVPASPRQPISGLATPYEVGRGATAAHDLERGIVQSDVMGASNLVTTVGDMLAWGQHVLTGSLGDRPLRELLARPGRLQDGSSIGYGAGFQLGRLGDRQVLQHGGTVSGYRSHLLIVPDEQLVVVVLANISDVRAAALSSELAQVVLAENAAAEQRQTQVARQLQHAAPDERVEGARYRGRYLLETGMTVSVQGGDEQLYLVMNGGMQPLIPREQDRFLLARQGIELQFGSNGNGSVDRLELDLPDGSLAAQRIEPITLSDWDLQRIRGRYFSAALDVYYELDGNQDALQLQRARGGDLKLVRIDEDLFLEAAPGNLVLKLERNRRGRVTGFVLSSPRARNIEFVRDSG